MNITKIWTDGKQIAVPISLKKPTKVGILVPMLTLPFSRLILTLLAQSCDGPHLCSSIVNRYTHREFLALSRLCQVYFSKKYGWEIRMERSIWTKMCLNTQFFKKKCWAEAFILLVILLGDKYLVKFKRVKGTIRKFTKWYP